LLFLDDEGATYAVRGALVRRRGEEYRRSSRELVDSDCEKLKQRSTTSGRNFQADEASYRRGFEAALKADPEPKRVQRNCPRANDSDEAFKCGYERGQSYQERLRERHKA